MWLSPLIGQSCRFVPTCSSYAVDCLSQYGFCKANSMILYRLLRCNPFCKGGYDPA